MILTEAPSLCLRTGLQLQPVREGLEGEDGPAEEAERLLDRGGCRYAEGLSPAPVGAHLAAGIGLRACCSTRAA